MKLSCCSPMGIVRGVGSIAYGLGVKLPFFCCRQVIRVTLPSSIRGLASDATVICCKTASKFRNMPSEATSDNYNTLLSEVITETTRVKTRQVYRKASWSQFAERSVRCLALAGITGYCVAATLTVPAAVAVFGIAMAVGKVFDKTANAFGHRVDERQISALDDILSDITMNAALNSTKKQD